MMEFTYEGIVRQGFGFYNPNHAAALICALLPFCWAALLRWKQPGCRIGFGVLTVLLTAALAATFSRTGAVIFFLELALYFFLIKGGNRRLLAGIATGAFLLFLFAGVASRFVLDRAVTNRFDIWLAGASLFAANPLRGVGCGNSGALATAFLLRDGIVCRTLVNSHLTLLAECGLFAGVLWTGAIAYALFSGWRKPAAYASFAGLCVAACSASVFDWGVLFDFRGHGELPLSNFILSWLLFLLFLGIGTWLCAGKFRWRRFAAAVGAAAAVIGALLLFPAGNAPEVRGGAIVPEGTGRILALLPPEFPLKDAAVFLKEHGYGECRIPLSRGAPEQPDGEPVVLFGSAAEYARFYAESPLVFVSPPGYFTLPAGTEKLYLKRFLREFRLEAQAGERNIPVVRY